MLDLCGHLPEREKEREGGERRGDESSCDKLAGRQGGSGGAWQGAGDVSCRIVVASNRCRVVSRRVVSLSRRVVSRRFRSLDDASVFRRFLIHYKNKTFESFLVNK